METAEKLLSLLLAALLFCMAGCRTGWDEQGGEGGNEAQETLHVIGVSVFSQSDPELSMFFRYYQNYIGEGFPVKFLLSDDLGGAEDEIAFIKAAKAQGAEGIISFYGLDLEQAVKACGENGMYYVLGSASISDDSFEAVKNNPWFLGVIGPDSDEEFKAGREMAESFAADGAGSFLILSGGAGEAFNFMHYTRVRGMLTALKEELGLAYDGEIGALAQITELTSLETGREDVRITISPGYLSGEEGAGNLERALAKDDFDAILSATGINSAIDLLAEELKTSETPVQAGVVDCFSRENCEAVEITGPLGNPLLRYVKGKYAPMAAPAFVAMFNALEGDADVVKPDGAAFRIYQTYWTAASAEEYAELYNYTQNIFENVYSAVELMDAIRIYNPQADFEAFRALVDNSALESVQARIGG